MRILIADDDLAELVKALDEHAIPRLEPGLEFKTELKSITLENVELKGKHFVRITPNGNSLASIEFNAKGAESLVGVLKKAQDVRSWLGEHVSAFDPRK